ncbi:MAG: MlaD family protein [Solirubrobacterales bacterium]
MGRKFSPSLIGSFVVGAIVLFIAALFLFGSGDLFKEKRRWVTFFDGSVGGLSVGAPVNFRGVRVGTVTDVRLMVDTKDLVARIPVYFEIEPDRINWVGGKEAQSQKLAIDAGLRAKLSMQSLVTGQMQVELDLLPDTPATLVGADPHTPELPAVASDFDVLKQQITQLPLPELVASVDQLVKKLDALVSSPEIGQSVKALAAALSETEHLLAAINQDAGPLMRELTITARSAGDASQQVTQSLRSLDGELKQTLGDVRELTGSTRADLKSTLRSADLALQQARTTLSSINGMVASDTNSRQDIDRALHNLAQASSALRSFADTVERNPNAIIVGR